MFWIYNAIWGAASLIILIPLLPTIAAMFAFRGEEGLAVLAGCLGLLVTMMLAILVAIVCALLTNRAIVSWAAHHTGAVESMRIGWQAIKGDLARHPDRFQRLPLKSGGIYLPIGTGVQRHVDEGGGEILDGRISLVEGAARLDLVDQRLRHRLVGLIMPREAIQHGPRQHPVLHHLRRVLDVIPRLACEPLICDL